MARSTVDRIKFFGKNCAAIVRGVTMDGNSPAICSRTSWGKQHQAHIVVIISSSDEWPGRSLRANIQARHESSNRRHGCCESVCLLTYRNATHSINGESLAMLLVGRGLMTRLEAVRPDTRKDRWKTSGHLSWKEEWLRQVVCLWR